ncbi:retropepsin-like aspartic protease [Hydrocoleum sp. CS-953]|uniref:retropepsin-like aspartic protease n=1 Tax=Hydrocoleum sp. CS-953 TaxID=1671698 RepID=UPI000B9BC528|nr:retropepsin-like aspartic protease [Hydrocoleum sp. CS-953]
MNRFKSITTIIIGAISCIIIAPSLAQLTPIIFPQNIVIFPRKNRSIGAIVQLEGLNLPRPKVTGKATIPLEFLDGGKAFTLKVTLGEKSGNFLLDTGASTTMISTETIKKLELTGEPVPPELLTYAVAGDECPEMKANLHRLPVLKIDNVKVENLTGLEFTTTVMPDGLSGVLGMDILSNFDVEINPQTQELRLLPPSPIPAKNINDAIPLKSKLGVMLAEVEINGKGPFIFMIDTGAESIFISQKLASQLKIYAAERQPIQVQGFCGIEMAEYASLAKVKMGNYELKNLETVILSSPVLKLLEVDGILGQNFLNNYQQYWRFNQKKTEKFPAGGSLLLISNPDN